MGSSSVRLSMRPSRRATVICSLTVARPVRRGRSVPSVRTVRTAVSDEAHATVPGSAFASVYSYVRRCVSPSRMRSMREAIFTAVTSGSGSSLWQAAKAHATRARSRIFFFISD